MALSRSCWVMACCLASGTFECLGKKLRDLGQVKLNSVAVRLQRRIAIGQQVSQNSHVILWPNSIEQARETHPNSPANGLPVQTCFAEFNRLRALLAVGLSATKRDDPRIDEGKNQATGACCAAGSTQWNTTPLPTLFSAQIRPP